MNAKEFDRKLDQEFDIYRKNHSDKLLAGSKFFNEIGSTRLEDISYNVQLDVKVKVLKELFNNNVAQDILNNLEIVQSPKITEYRFKSEFVTSYNPKFEPYNRFGQRKKNNFSWVVDLDEYVLVESEIFNKVRQVYDYALSIGINGYDLKKNTGDMRYLTLKTYKQESMLIITSANDDERFNMVMNFTLKNGFKSVYWLKNNTKHDSYEGEILKFIGSEYIQVPITVKDHTYTFNVGPFTFFQNNIYCFEKLLAYVSNFTAKNEFSNRTLYDLYCGVGLFGITLANQFKEVKGIEIVKESIDLAEVNKKLNNIKNINFEVKDIKNITFVEDETSVVLVDPPRNGLEDKGIENILQINPEYIIYISCNPVTLNIDLDELQKKYRILDLKIFDTFPLTYHLESLCIMQKI